MYTKDYQVEYFMCNQDGYLKPNYLFHMLSDIMGRNAASYGADFEYHLQRNLVWVLVNYEVSIKRMPKADETIVVGTLPYSFKKMYGFRVYEVKDQNGNVIIEGKGKFVLLNYSEKKLVIPDQALLDLFVDAKKEEIAIPFEKIRSLKETPLVEKKTMVNASYIDINGHMNNAVYVAVANDFAPQDFVDLNTVSNIYVAYKKEAFLNDEITLQYIQSDGLKQVRIISKELLLCEITFKFDR